MPTIGGDKDVLNAGGWGSSLSFALMRIHSLGLSADESESLMVFLHGASVNRVESIPRTIADFDDNCLNQDFKRAAAEFIVEKRPRVYIVCR